MKLRNILIVLIVLTSCISEVDVQLPQTERVVTLNCILRPESDTIITHMAYSRPLLSIENFEGIKNEEVRLFEDGKLSGYFIKSDSTAWYLPFRVMPGKKYKVEVTNKEKLVWGETTIPKNIDVDISIVEVVSYRFDYQISFTDNKNEDNFYWISAKGYSQYNGKPYLEHAPALYTNYSLADDFNRYVETFAGYQYMYEDYIRIADKMLPEESINCQFNPASIDINNGPQEIFVLSVDYNLDKYMKSSLLMEENDLWAEEVPIVYAPFAVYSNVHNGTGIVGSYNSYFKAFTKE